MTDTERLDWLASTYNHACPEFFTRAPGTTHELGPTGRWIISIRGTRSAVVGSSLREVIDKAMQEHSGEDA